MSVYFACYDEDQLSGKVSLRTEAIQRTKRGILDKNLIIDRIITSPLLVVRAAAKEIAQTAGSDDVQISVDERWLDFDIDALMYWLRNGWHGKSSRPERELRPLDKILTTIASAYEDAVRLPGVTLIISNSEVYKFLQAYIQRLSIDEVASLKGIKNGEIIEIVKGGIDE
ncbi:hypothetical protein FBF27_01970 [Candidatus Saccharibacteria bacterium oral taxon 488]|nr:hypothetical protein FBF27_01970 [Candidatus Saccharibacteria bacterium oral taxon 488]